VVVEDLGARTARAGVGHLPEIVRRVARALVVADADDALDRHADLLGPDVVRFVVLVIDGDPQLLFRQLVHGGQQLPGVLDRVALEVVAEAEIAQHLEEGVVARGVADVLEVVVLAAGAHAALHRGGALVRTRSRPRNTSLNCTMPELVNSMVGSLPGTSGLDRTIVWPLDSKKDRNLERISADFMVDVAMRQKNDYT
jgi:hypothetical protein